MIYMVRTDAKQVFSPFIQINAKSPEDALTKVLEQQDKTFFETKYLKKAPRKADAQFEVTENGMKRFYNYYFVAVERKFADVGVISGSAIKGVWYNGQEVPVQGKQIFKCVPSQTILFYPNLPNTGIGVQEKNKVEWLCSKEYKRAKVRMGLNNFRNGDKENLLFIEQRADGKIIFNLDKSLGIVKSASFILLR